MFDQVNGLPVHALVLHAAVVFIPLLALAAIVYALVARWRPRIGWAVVLLAIVAPVTAFVSKESGEKLYDRLVAQGLQGRGKEIIEDHSAFATVTFWLTVGLAVLTLVVALLTLRGNRLPRAADLGLGLVMVVLAAATGYYVFRTGDSGATAVWGTY